MIPLESESRKHGISLLVSDCRLPLKQGVSSIILGVSLWIDGGFTNRLLASLMTSRASVWPPDLKDAVCLPSGILYISKKLSFSKRRLGAFFKLSISEN